MPIRIIAIRSLCRIAFFAMHWTVPQMMATMGIQANHGIENQLETTGSIISPFWQQLACNLIRVPASILEIRPPIRIFPKRMLCVHLYRLGDSSITINPSSRSLSKAHRFQDIAT